MTEPTYNPDRHSPDYEFRPFPGSPPANAPKRKGWRIRHIAAAYAVGGLILGSALASAAVKPERVEVTKEVPGPERTVTKEVKVEVPVTPAACITALDLNEQAFSGLAESMRLVTEGDYAGAKANTDKVSLLVPRVNAAKAECRTAQ